MRQLIVVKQASMPLDGVEFDYAKAAKFFDHLVDLVPAKYYLDTGEEQASMRGAGLARRRPFPLCRAAPPPPCTTAPAARRMRATPFPPI